MFGASNTGGGFGTTPSFGAATNTSMFGGTSAFGAQQQKPPAFGGTSFGGGGGGGLFGATSQPATGGGLFGGTNTTTSSFGGGGTAFGSSGFKPGGFGQTTQAQGGGGLFGATTTSQSGGLFGSSTGTTSFGAPSTGTGFGGGANTSFGFGGAQQTQQAGTAHVKFNPVQGSDTMMKSGQQTSISTRHQCISCMKEYENKSQEELRCEDYMAGRKGTAGAAGGTTGGLFGATQPVASGGLFGAQPAATQSGGLFGQQKPLFGTSTAGGFGATATAAAPAFGTTGAFGATAQPAAGGLFGAAKPAFGQTATSTTGFGGFGQTQTSQAGGLFGQAAKPFGAVAPNQTSGGMFGQPAATTGFGQPAATGFGGFGQPQQQQQQPTIGLFGAQNQAKPAFGGFGAAQPTSAAPAFGGFGATATTQQAGGMFGATAAKPAFGGFGAATSQPSTGFGGFGATSTGGGGLFGASQQKPAFSFGGATASAAPAFGGFGATTATTGGGMFGSTAKPGGLFGGGTTGFGVAPTGFGGTSTGFGAGATNTGFGGGLNFSQQQPTAAAPPAANSAVQQQLLLALASSPFGENPLFKPVLETGKRAEVLKPGATTGPLAQKVLSSSQYKVSPHRNIKVRAKAMDSGNKSSMFDGLDDDLPSPGDMFVPRSSVKKLVLRPKKDAASPGMVRRLAGDELITETSLTVPLDEDNLQVKRADLPPRPDNARDISLAVDESFAALNPKKKVQQDLQEVEEEEDEDGDKSVQNTSKDSGDTDKDDDGSCHPGGVVLKRAGYYTIPALSEIQPDSEGNCFVEGFTIGREGYGNIHYPGLTNLAGLNLDDIVFFRHKEVIVYPDDTNKPALGDALNKKAQITLDKVWPTDKQDGSIIKSPERLRAMNYEEKLIRASSRLDARFIEYRAETGSWVFKVDHFSKYGLDESDEEEVVTTTNANKKVKTLQLEKRRSTLDAPADNRTATLLLNENQRNLETVESDGAESEERDVVMNDVSSSILQQKSFIRSALFSEVGDEDDMIQCPSAKPVILQHRTNSLLEARPRLIEEIASSILAPTAAKGLGGTSFQMSDTSYNTSLLRSHYSSQMSMQLNNSSMLQQSRTQQQPQNRNKTTRLPSYTLTGGYDRFTQLPAGQGPETVETVTPQYVDEEVPLQRSYLHKRFQQFADSGLFQNKRFRVGFGSGSGNGADHVENPGGGFLNYADLDRKPLDEWELASLQQWMQISLETSTVEVTEDGPVYSPTPNLQTLYTHCVEAKRQYQECESGGSEDKVWELRHTWDLLLTLWGRLQDHGEDGEDMDTEIANLETHADTVGRRQKLARWLELGVEERSRREVLEARERKDHLGKVRGLLTGGKVEEACEALQTAGDHRTALLVAQAGGGGLGGRLVQQQLDRWTEVKADRFINKDRINLFSLVAGQPVHQGTEDMVNTCSRLDWQRSLAHHLWFLTHPISSISDTLATYDAAWTGAQPYAARPEPSYSETASGSLEDGAANRPLDLKYQLIKLYADRSHKLEKILAPTTHTSDQLDFRSSWLIYRVLHSLGYKVGCPGNSDRLSCDFAGQLERLGLWEWAVFVLLNVNNEELRKRSVCTVLERNVSLEEEDEGKEAWLVDRLGVPSTWLAAARAVLARTRGKHTQLADQLIKAKDWNEAHKVIIAELAPAAILSQDYAQLQSFLNRIMHPHIADQITGWESEGKVYLQFIDVDNAINRFRQTRDINNLGYELERLKPLVTNLCRTISNLPVHNAKQRLSQSEIAKKVAHFMRAVYSFESGSGQHASVTARQLAESLSTLPLPEDYALQELRTLTNSYLAEIMDS